jgi:hypothetical protein
VYRYANGRLGISTGHFSCPDANTSYDPTSTSQSSHAFTPTAFTNSHATFHDIEAGPENGNPIKNDSLVPEEEKEKAPPVQMVDILIH